MLSPKRKRDVHEPDASSAPHSPSRVRSGTPDLISGPHRLFPGIGSPRARIVREFEGLQIKGEAVSKIDWEKEIPRPRQDVDSDAAESKRMRQVAKKPKLGKSKGLEVFEQAIVDVDVAQPIPPELPAREPVSNASNEGRKPDQHPASGNPELTSTGREEEEVLASKRSRSRQKASVRAETKQENPLTWQEHEITGHRIDDPDDDGEGLNGVGFMPTPAMAYARVEKRRQQIQEYKNREAREARRIRGERRRGENVQESVVGLQNEARRVRFAEVGNG